MQKNGTCNSIMILHFRNIPANNNLWFPHKIHKENFASQFFLNSDSINALLCMPQNFANFADPYRGQTNYVQKLYILGLASGLASRARQDLNLVSQSRKT